MLGSAGPMCAVYVIFRKCAVNGLNLVGVFDLTYYEFADEFSKFKMADRVRRRKITQFECKLVSGFFGIADYESALIFLKLKIGDQMWPKKNKKYPMLIKIGMSKFCLFGSNL